MSRVAITTAEPADGCPARARGSAVHTVTSRAGADGTTTATSPAGRIQHSHSPPADAA